MSIQNDDDNLEIGMWQLSFLNAYVMIEVYNKKEPPLFPDILLYILCEYWIHSPQNVLYEGCKYGTIESVFWALKHGASIDDRSAVRRMLTEDITLFQLAVSKGHCNIVEFLINLNCDILKYRFEFDNSTCLHSAVNNNDIKMCKLLLSHRKTLDINVNHRDKLGRTVLMDAADINAEDIINILLKNKTDANIEDKEQYTALSYMLDTIYLLRLKSLHSAICLINYGANPNYKGKCTGYTMLHFAAARGDLDLVKLLIEKKRACPIMYDHELKTPLDYAIEYGNTDVVEYYQTYTGKPGCSCVVL